MFNVFSVLCVFITCVLNMNSILFYCRELYKSVTSTMTFDYSSESLDSSGFEDAERMKVRIKNGIDNDSLF